MVASAMRKKSYAHVRKVKVEFWEKDTLLEEFIQANCDS